MELSKPPTYRLILDYGDKKDSQNFLVHYSSCEDNGFLLALLTSPRSG